MGEKRVKFKDEIILRLPYGKKIEGENKISNQSDVNQVHCEYLYLLISKFSQAQMTIRTYQSFNLTQVVPETQVVLPVHYDQFKFQSARNSLHQESSNTHPISATLAVFGNRRTLGSSRSGVNNGGGRRIGGDDDGRRRNGGSCSWGSGSGAAVDHRGWVWSVLDRIASRKLSEVCKVGTV